MTSRLDGRNHWWPSAESHPRKPKPIALAILTDTRYPGVFIQRGGGGELAQAFERVAVRAGHVHQHLVGRMGGHRLQQSFVGTKAQDGDAGIGGKPLRQQANAVGIIVDQQDLRMAGVTGSNSVAPKMFSGGRLPKDDRRQDPRRVRYRFPANVQVATGRRVKVA